MLRSLFTLLAIVAAMATADHITGGYGPTKSRVSLDAKTDFFAAVGDDAHYAPETNGVRVCATTFVSVSQQVVAGINYKFRVKGCAVDRAANAVQDCACPTDAPRQTYEISIFVQGWTDTYAVNSITNVTDAKADL
ncbi:hypothetical protein SPRG_19707 [Saprolegnia parasitica CBS 223.65]|uniref:Cystatin domain-containing protein n=1 Tax=Saprolegnia parasitica (strain CBS 223.65) TaxID=695850 RepID=A0A067CKU9_SAPPC|nr:hypothetical protein SPRG_19707 [Saprolegnia parasitica CBS 223.65]KDO29820.1 hypothetical protein SPRG_19707 [Saprolegnia parasitica CBS 223.65]|eukprot:XP_012199527.1 hypothetical protein SPRG_19707 [Saprolegnia parasitica CBS 223.65]